MFYVTTGDLMAYAEKFEKKEEVLLRVYFSPKYVEF